MTKICCSRSLSIPILHLAKIHHANKLLQLNFKNKSDFFHYYFLFKLSAITRFCSSRVTLRELDQERKWRHLLMSLIFKCVNPAN